MAIVVAEGIRSAAVRECVRAELSRIQSGDLERRIFRLTGSRKWRRWKVVKAAYD